MKPVPDSAIEQVKKYMVDLAKAGYENEGSLWRRSGTETWMPFPNAVAEMLEKKMNLQDLASMEAGEPCILYALPDENGRPHMVSNVPAEYRYRDNPTCGLDFKVLFSCRDYAYDALGGPARFDTTLVTFLNHFTGEKFIGRVWGYPKYMSVWVHKLSTWIERHKNDEYTEDSYCKPISVDN